MPIFNAKDGWLASTTIADEANTPLQVYQAWCAELNITAAAAANLSALDDTNVAVQLAAPIIAGGASDKIGFGSEGGLVFSKNIPGNAGSVISFTPAGLGRFYVPTPQGDFDMITFHPNSDNYSSNSLYNTVGTTTMIYSEIGASGGSGPRVKFAARFNGSDTWQLALQNFAGWDIPVTLWSCTMAMGVFASSVLTTMSGASPAMIRITGEAFIGTMSGTVKDASGAFAARKVMLYDRANGALLGSTISDATSGAFNIKTPPASVAGGTYFLVVLDDDTAPDLNALIYDRVTL